MLSHQGADEVIKNVGEILKNWSEKVNMGAVKGQSKYNKREYLMLEYLMDLMFEYLMDLMFQTIDGRSKRTLH